LYSIGRWGEAGEHRCASLNEDIKIIWTGLAERGSHRQAPKAICREHFSNRAGARYCGTGASDILRGRYRSREGVYFITLEDRTARGITKAIVKFETPPAQLLATVNLEVIGQFSLFPPWSRSTRAGPERTRRYVPAFGIELQITREGSFRGAPSTNTCPF
jgi:hypothetical protein